MLDRLTRRAFLGASATVTVGVAGGAVARLAIEPECHELEREFAAAHAAVVAADERRKKTRAAFDAVRPDVPEELVDGAACPMRLAAPGRYLAPPRERDPLTFDLLPADDPLGICRHVWTADALSCHRDEGRGLAPVVERLIAVAERHEAAVEHALEVTGASVAHRDHYVALHDLAALIDRIVATPTTTLAAAIFKARAAASLVALDPSKANHFAKWGAAIAEGLASAEGSIV